MPKVRLIDANALAESDMAKLIDRYLYNQCNLTVGLAAALMPEIESEPVRHGRWETWGYVFHGIEWKRCSCCGKCADVSYYGLLDGEIRMSTPAICGGCGADMREEGANNEHQV